MGKEHRLRPLKMGVPRQVGIAGGDRRCKECVLQGGQALVEIGHGDLAPQPKVGGALIIAATAGVHFGASEPGDFRDSTLYCRVNVFIAGSKNK